MFYQTFFIDGMTTGGQDHFLEQNFATLLQQECFNKGFEFVLFITNNTLISIATRSKTIGPANQENMKRHLEMNQEQNQAHRK